MNTNDQVVFQKDLFSPSSLVQVISDPFKPSESKACLPTICLSNKCLSSFSPQISWGNQVEALVGTFVPRLPPRSADSEFPCVSRGLGDTDSPGVCDPLKHEADLEAQGGEATQGILRMSPSSALSTPVLDLTASRRSQGERRPPLCSLPAEGCRSWMSEPELAPKESSDRQMPPARTPSFEQETRAGRRVWGSGSRTRREVSPDVVA